MITLASVWTKMGNFEEAIYGIEEIQRRIPRQQDGVYYLTVVRGDISPYPTGGGFSNGFSNGFQVVTP
jgi:hypothetical protein